MKRTTITRSLLTAVGLALALAALQASAQPGINAPRGNCYLNQNLPGANTAPTQALTEAEKTALNTAIQDEYKSRATYNKILDTFGQVMPFANIVNAESRHVEALAFLYKRYEVPIPADTWADKVPAYATLNEAAEAAVQAEQENGALYDTITENVSNPEVINVFNALRFATMEHHLPAFQRLVDFQNGQVPAAPGMGRGMGRGACCGACPYGVSNAPASGSGMGAGRGRGAGWNQGNGMGAGRGRGAGRNQGNGMGAGRGRGAGWNQGYGPGRGYGSGPNRPYNNPAW